MSAGEGLAVLVNANAKRGGRRIAVQIARLMPAAEVRLTKTQAEISTWLHEVLPKKPDVIVAAGGDGTAIALVNALARVVPAHEPLPPIGVLKLGTGNAWANVVGAPKLADSLAILRELHERDEALPLRRFGLVDVGYPPDGEDGAAPSGTLTHFAGAGWDAEILSDYKEQLAASKGPPRFFAKSVYGYVTAMLTRTAPKSIVLGRPHVLVENLGDEVYTVDASGALKRLEGVGRGSVLWDGLMSVAGAATCPGVRVPLPRLPLRRALPRHAQRARVRPLHAGRHREHSTIVDGDAPAPRHARLVHQGRALHVLASDGYRSRGRRAARTPHRRDEDLAARVPRARLARHRVRYVRCYSAYGWQTHDTRQPGFGASRTRRRKPSDARSRSRLPRS